jgi:hypothetical protein
MNTSPVTNQANQPIVPITTMNTDEDTAPRMTFALKMFTFDGESAEQGRDLNESRRLHVLGQEIEARDGSEAALAPEHKFSSQFVIQQAAERYYSLVRHAIQSLDMVFTTDEMKLVLNTNCSPIWNWSLYSTVANVVFETYGFDELSNHPSDVAIRTLVEKLMKLTHIQNAALVDLCERFWRGNTAGSLRSCIEKLGLILAE